MRASLAAPLLPPLALLALLASCTSSSTGTPTPTTPTLVAIAPDDFLGNVPCADAPGAMRRYVATIYDVTPGIGGDGGPTEFALPSSGPVPCARQIAFGGGFVLQGHRYVADIQGYDRTDIEPLGSGSSVMVNSKTGAVVKPRWTTSCGRGTPSTAGDAGSTDAGSTDAASTDAGSTDAASTDAASTDAASTDAASTDAASTDAASADAAGAEAGGADAGSADASPAAPQPTGHPAVAAQYQTVYVRGCAPLAAQQPPGVTGISVGIDAAMRSPLALACGSAAGQIARYRVSLDGSTTAPLEAACDQRVTFFSLTPGSGYHFTLEAFEQGATAPTWATHCFQTTLDGAIAPAACDPLTDQGGIQLDSAALLAKLGLSCGDQLVALDAELATTPVQSAVQTPPECQAPIRFSGLTAGLYGIDVTTTLTTGAGPSASCVASVEPAGTSLAKCTPN